MSSTATSSTTTTPCARRSATTLVATTARECIPHWITARPLTTNASRHEVVPWGTPTGVHLPSPGIAVRIVPVSSETDRTEGRSLHAASGGKGERTHVDHSRTDRAVGRGVLRRTGGGAVHRAGRDGRRVPA